MYGAIIGDIVGSRHEFNSIKSKDFLFVSRNCTFTDDTVMTVAVARALLQTKSAIRHGDLDPLKTALVAEMQSLGREYPGAGYGGNFDRWIWSDNPQPYNSYGNGSAMRVSPCGIFASSLEEALALAKASAEVTHNHPEGIKGAQATAAAIYLAKSGHSKEDIGAYVWEHFYDYPGSVEEIRPDYSFDVSCQGSVPESIVCFLESNDYEDAVRNAVSLGGDADTQGAIAGSIAWAYYRPGCESAVAKYGIDKLLPREFVKVIKEFESPRGILRRFAPRK